MQMICERCGKSFNEKPARIKEGRGRFCSRACQYVLNTIEIHGDVAHVHLTDRYGNLKAIARIDAAAVPRLKELGKRWAPTWSEGYGQYRAVARLKSGNTLMHRWLTNAPPDAKVDHIDGDTLNNVSSNLRFVTVSENGQNRRGARRDNATGVRGVQKTSHSNTYYATAKVNGVSYRVHGFSTIEEAEQAAIALRRKHMTHSQN